MLNVPSLVWMYCHSIFCFAVRTGIVMEIDRGGKQFSFIDGLIGINRMVKKK